MVRQIKPRRALALECLVAFASLLFAGCASDHYITRRPFREHALASTLHYFSPSGPQISDRTQGLLTRYDLAKTYEQAPEKALEQLQQQNLQNPQQLYAIAEVAYILGHRAERQRDGGAALRYYGTALQASYRYLLGPEIADQRNVFDPQFRRAADLYNETLEDALRLLCSDGKEQIKPGESYIIHSGDHELKMRVAMQGKARQKWRPEDFSQFKFVSDYRITDLLHNRHITFGLGVPLIAVHPECNHSDPMKKYYPEGLSFAVTALLRCPSHTEPSELEQPGFIGASGPLPMVGTSMPPKANEVVLELYDPLSENEVNLHNRWVPLETDVTTPLAFFLDTPQFREKNTPTAGLLNPEKGQEARGLYMLEPYDPNRIPVLMVHGLWSSPLTWMDMFNDLRSFPEIRERYQFWFYLYPTGQPFWISAVQLRNDLADAREKLKAKGESEAIDQMVLVGHSMGGLVSRLQTIDSGDDFWKIVSDRPKEELKGDPDDRMKLVSTLYFKPNQAVKRVITIGTPHRGSNFANNTVRWLGRQIITLPTFVRDTGSRLAQANPDYFRNTEILTTTTSFDSLSNKSPIFPVMMRAKTASWTRLHNIVGVVEDERFLSGFTTRGDRIVSYDSAHLEPDQAVSEIVVNADHTTIHTTPEAILEVRRILLEHRDEIDHDGRVAQRDNLPPSNEPSLSIPPDAYTPNMIAPVSNATAEPRR